MAKQQDYSTGLALLSAALPGDYRVVGQEISGGRAFAYVGATFGGDAKCAVPIPLDANDISPNLLAEMEAFFMEAKMRAAISARDVRLMQQFG